MRTHPQIKWLINRWNLPEKEVAITQIEKLLNSEREEGGTAAEIEQEVGSWGNSVTRIPDQDDGTSPLVMVKGASGASFLQSRRCFQAEKSIAHHLMDLSAGSPPLEVSEERIQQLFPDANESDRQVAAARTALFQRLTLITGGPGTGKTYTLARILALLLGAGVKDHRIRLAAPTGKAADRMKQSIEASLGTLEDNEKDALRMIANRSSTLHSLLGANPSTGRCRHNAGNPLPCDVLIVDECSMVDLHLWKVLLESLGKDARLILLGDPKQLQSVGQGNVFGALAEFASLADTPLKNSLIHLTESRRFRNRPGIMKLAKALEDSDSKMACEVLLSAEKHPEEGIVWIESAKGMPPYERIPESLRNSIETAANASNPEAALDSLGKVCILTAHRISFMGAESISRGISRELAKTSISLSHALPPNEPIIINENDPETGLRNGAVGMICTESDGKRRAWFRKELEIPKPYSIGSLPDYSPAWAITIHRSQGSEYDDILVILPQEISVMATTELLYTAITRAKKKVIIVGTMGAVKKAVETPSRRVTLLKEALVDAFVPKALLT